MLRRTWRGRTEAQGLLACAGAQIRQMDLPEQVQISLVGAPSIFSVPTCINKAFKPPFTVRVTVTSSQPMKVPLSITAYTLQKEQVTPHFAAAWRVSASHCL